MAHASFAFNEVELKKAISLAPRGERAKQLLEVSATQLRMACAVAHCQMTGSFQQDRPDRPGTFY